MFLTQFFKSDFAPKLYEIRLFTAFVSLLLSILAFWQDDLINSDGVLYMNMARAFIDGGISEMSQLYNWPFFSILVACVHLITGLPLETSGNLVNIIMFVIFTDALVLICSKNLPNLNQVFIASLFILGFSLFNDYRAYLFRDLGYWAFSALSIYLFIKFLEKPTWLNSIIWQCAMVFAILFRVEGIVILLLLPLFVFFNNRNLVSASNQLIKLWLPLTIISLVSIFIALSISGFTAAFTKLTDIFIYIDIKQVYTVFDEKSTVIADQLLNKYSERYSSLILSSGLIIMMLWKFVEAISIGYFIYITYILLSKHKPIYFKSKYSQLLLYYVVINFIILLAFVFTKYFLSTRYSVMLMAGVFLLLTPVFCQYFEYAVKHKRKGIIAFTFFIIIAGTIDSISKTVSKAYIKDVAIWAAGNLPENSNTAVFDREVNYYMFENDSKSNVIYNPNISYQDAFNFDFFIVVVKRRETELLEEFYNSGYEQIFKSKNNRGDAAYVYKRIKNE